MTISAQQVAENVKAILRGKGNFKSPLLTEYGIPDHSVIQERCQTTMRDREHCQTDC